MKFIKKPVTIDAVKWRSHLSTPMAEVGINPKGIEGDEPLQCRQCGSVEEHGWIETLEGGHIVCPGDWIITGVKGEKYPCKPDIFEATYVCADRQVVSPCTIPLEFTMPEGFRDGDIAAGLIEEAISEIATVDPWRRVPFSASNGVRISSPPVVARPMEIFIDGEWNGYGGELISLALVDLEGRWWYKALPVTDVIDPWVAENVLPVMGSVETLWPDEFARSLEAFLSQYPAVHLVADWPEDIERFCQALVTGPGKRIDTPPLTMEVRRDLDDADSAVPHNALEDARAMRDHYLALMGDA